MTCCLVCGAILPAFSHDNVCSDEACRHLKVHCQLQPPKTELERRLLAIRLEQTRINFAKKKAEQAEKERLLTQELARRERENRSYRQKLLEARPDMANYPWMVLPSGRKKSTNLPMRRRRKFRDFLNKLIGQLYSNRQEETKFSENQPSPYIVKLQNQFCSACQGGCCANGSNNAYLSVETLLKFRRLNVLSRPRHVLEAYLDRLPNKSFADSCIYHTEKGCNLPREMRSEICNRFLCSPVTEFCVQHDEEMETAGVLLLLRRQDLWRQTDIELNNDLIGAYVVENLHVQPLDAK